MPATPTAGNCGDANLDTAVTATDALLIVQTAVGQQVGRTPLVCDVVGGVNGVTATDGLQTLLTAVGATSQSDLRCPSAARWWDEQLLNAIRIDTPRPTVHARNLFHLSVAMWDAWTAFDELGTAHPYLSTQSPPTPTDVHGARNEAISYACYRILSQRFNVSPGASASQAAFDAAMEALGYDRNVVTATGDSAAAVGNRIAADVLAFGAADGANETGDYADDTGYTPVNAPLIVDLPGTTMNDPNRWQPLSLDFFETQNGIPQPIEVQEFISPNWGGVTPFALVRSGPGLPYVDPGLPPQLGGDSDAEFKAAILEVLRFSSWLDPDDGVIIDVSPGAIGNNTLGTVDGNGHASNPVTGPPYAANPVKRGDYGRVLAEFWADGPDSETPPGHWNTLANYVADHPLTEKRIGATGAVLDALEWDVKVYLALNGAMHDAAVAAWGAKAIYDYVRPISMIRHMAGLGQSTDSAGPSYHPSGFPLVAGLSEVITAASSASGERHEQLSEFIGEIAVRSWRGNPADPENEYSGSGWTRAVEWVPYQRETFVTPAFAAYVSGHSTFSRAGAEVLTGATGSAYFPGGIGEFRAPPDLFLEFELGPTQEVALQRATYADAADEAGISRLWGGIHVPADDFKGRIMGARIGSDAFNLAESYWQGTATP